MLPDHPASGKASLATYASSAALDDKDGVRLLTNAGGVGLTSTAAPDPDDRVVEGANLPVYIAPEAVAALEEATIDAKTERSGSILPSLWCQVPLAASLPVARLGGI